MKTCQVSLAFKNELETGQVFAFSLIEWLNPNPAIITRVET